MDAAENTLMTPVLIIISCFPFVYLLFKFLDKQWFAPIRLQRKMRAQGIRGPRYKFIHGNTKEMMDLRTEALARPMEISHDIYPRILPEVHLWSKIYGRNHLHWFGTEARITVRDPEMVKEIMSDRDGAFPKPPNPNAEKMYGDGLATTTNGKKWSKLRKVANHAFNGESLKNMLPEMVVSAEMMLQRWRDYVGKEVEVFEEFRLLTSDVISRTAFGSSYLEGQKIFEMSVKLVALTAKSYLTVKIPVISGLMKDADEIEIQKLQKEIRETVIRMIRGREERIVKGESCGGDFLGALVKSYKDPDHTQRMSLDEVIDECRTFYIAGQETTNTTLSWVIFLLAIHQDWQEEARREVISTFGQENPTHDGIAKLKIMSMILCETLRLYPVTRAQLRHTVKEVKLGSLVLPANTNLLIPTLAIHHDPQIWGKDVLAFKPERFAEGIAKATNNDMAAYIPFGFGPRMCAGSNFATNEAKIALSMILQRYKFTLSPSYVHAPILVITIRPQYGVKVMLQSV